MDEPGSADTVYGSEAVLVEDLRDSRTWNGSVND